MGLVNINYLLLILTASSINYSLKIFIWVLAGGNSLVQGTWIAIALGRNALLFRNWYVGYWVHFWYIFHFNQRRALCFQLDVKFLFIIDKFWHIFQLLWFYEWCSWTTYKATFVWTKVGVGSAQKNIPVSFLCFMCNSLSSEILLKH